MHSESLVRLQVRSTFYYEVYAMLCLIKLTVIFLGVGGDGEGCIVPKYHLERIIIFGTLK